MAISLNRSEQATLRGLASGLIMGCVTWRVRKAGMAAAAVVALPSTVAASLFEWKAVEADRPLDARVWRLINYSLILAIGAFEIERGARQTGLNWQQGQWGKAFLNGARACAGSQLCFIPFYIQPYLPLPALSDSVSGGAPQAAVMGTAAEELKELVAKHPFEGLELDAMEGPEELAGIELMTMQYSFWVDLCDKRALYQFDSQARNECIASWGELKEKVLAFERESKGAAKDSFYAMHFEPYYKLVFSATTPGTPAWEIARLSALCDAPPEPTPQIDKDPWAKAGHVKALFAHIEKEHMRALGRALKVRYGPEDKEYIKEFSDHMSEIQLKGEEDVIQFLKENVPSRGWFERTDAYQQRKSASLIKILREKYAELYDPTMDDLYSVIAGPFPTAKDWSELTVGLGFAGDRFDFSHIPEVLSLLESMGLDTKVRLTEFIGNASENPEDPAGPKLSGPKCKEAILQTLIASKDKAALLANEQVFAN